MQNNKHIIAGSLFAALLALGFFVFFNYTAPAAGNECLPSQTTWTDTEKDSDEFKCESASCGANVLKRERYKEYSCWNDGCGDTGCEFTGYTYSAPSVLQDLGSWAKCSSYQDDWQTTAPNHGCSGSCLEAPTGEPSYYDNPSYAGQPDKNKGSENLLLPASLGWDDVVGWNEQYGPQSYKITIRGAETTTGTTERSDFTAPSCSLNSGSSYNWQVQACCTASGENCGPQSQSWSFNTILAPEPISPYDPDWTGQDIAQNAELPAKLSWCSVESADYYKLRINILTKDEKETCHPSLVSPEGCKEIDIRPTKILEDGKEKIALSTEFDDKDTGFFTKLTKYVWQIGAYFIKNGSPSEYFSQKWGFESTGELSNFILFNPVNDPEEKRPVGLPIIFEWQSTSGTNSFNYKIGPYSGTTRSSQVKFDYPQLKLKTAYDWQVAPCWDYEGKECETGQTQKRHFITTGFPPKLLSPQNSSSEIPIPVKLDWEDVPGAASYAVKIQGEGMNFEKTINKDSELTLGYPGYTPKQETQYVWQVKTCSWENGEACGEFSGPISFKTFKLPPPKNPSPPDNSQMSTAEKIFSWSEIEGIKNYQYKIKYSSLAAEEPDNSCRSEVGKEITGLTSVAQIIQPLKCLGQYQWQARACLDEDCLEAGEWSQLWNFNFVEPKEIGKGGLIPCGQLTDNPKTFWNERESCQPKHLFLLFKIIIDFLLFRLAPLAVVLMILYSGLLFYFSLGRAITLARTISLWKSIGIGLVIIFFAWMFINVILRFIGYQSVFF